MYLETVVNNKREEECEINLRLAKSNRCVEALNDRLRSNTEGLSETL